MKSLLLIVSACSLFGIACDDEPAGSGGTDTGSETDTGGETDLGETDMGMGDMGMEDQGMGDTGMEDTGTEDTTMIPDADQPDVIAPGACDPDDCDGVCRGGECVAEVDPDDYETALTEDPASYFWSLQLPALYPEPETCCFDFTNDGNPDDGLGALLGLLGTFLGDTDVSGLIEEALADGTVTLLAHWMGGFESEGRFGLNLGEWTGEADYDARVDGDGTYAVNESSIDEYGPQVQFSYTVEDGTLTAGPSTFVLNLPVADLLGDDLTLVLDGARIEADVTEEEDGIHTVDETRAGTDGDFFVAGGRLGGALEATQLLTLLDEQMRACDCGGIDSEEPVMTWSSDTDSGAFSISCNPDNNGSGTPACTDEDGTICGNIGTVCGAIGILASVFDVDQRACAPVSGDGTECGPGTDVACECTPGRDGVNESISVGLRFALTGASVDGFATEATE